MTRRWVAMFGTLLMSGLTGVSCSSGNSGADCSTAVTKMRSCGLLSSSGPVECRATVTADVIACEEQCVANATCAEVTAAYCNGEANSIIDCMIGRCPFQCSDGTSVPKTYQCDGYPDCADGSDEGASCPTFLCGNGTKIAASAQCDGNQNCSDGSDENNCPPTPELTCP